MRAFVLFCFFAVFYAYFGYPLILRTLRSLGIRRFSKPAENPGLPSMTVIVTVRNEERVVREKIENTLALRYSMPVQIIVASDASVAGTDDAVREYASRGVELVRLHQRGGKEHAQRLAVGPARGDVILFTDAKIKLQPDALERVAEYFRDERIGAVSSIDRIEGEGSGEDMYVRYEMALRAMESDVNSLVGLSGSCFAVRRDVTADLRVDIPSDFALLLEARRRGLSGVHAPDVVGTYQAVASEEAEFKRKVRTVLRGMTALYACREVMNPSRYGMFAWQVFSHKLCRWLVPWFLAFAAVSLLTSAKGDAWLELLLVLSFAFVILAAAGFFVPSLRRKRICKLPLFFLIVNAGIAVAWFHFLRGRRTVAWNPSDKGR